MRSPFPSFERCQEHMKNIYDIHHLAEKIKELKQQKVTVVATSGGFDPIHVGHIACLADSAKLYSNSVLIAIVNGDGFLIRKKGKPFMIHQERMGVVSAIRYVDYVTGWDDGSQTVCGALEILKPDAFTKGGDRSARAVVPEAEICDRIGCTIVYGVGGSEKLQSSSDLIKGI